MKRFQLIEFIKNSDDRIDTNKGLAFFGALVGAIILIIAALDQHASLEWLLTVYLVATMGQLPSKGLNDLGRLKIERGTDKNGRSNYVTDMNVTDIDPPIKREDRS